MSGLDWNPVTNKIISCSHDKNIYVWQYNEDSDTWLAELVIFKSKLSILGVKWDKQGQKFCGSSGGKLIVVGFYSPELGWWKGEEIRIHKSAVTCATFDPSGTFVISGSTDLKIEITSSYLKDIDSSKEINTGFSDSLLKVSNLN